MTNETQSIISVCMESLGINYAFMQWDAEPVYPYFVGEYQEIEPLNEDGMQESMFILSGFSRGSYEELEQAKDAIKKFFNIASGKRFTAEDGSTVEIFYSQSLVVRTGDAELKKIQINLKVKEWSVY